MKIKFVYGFLPAFVFYREGKGEVKNYATGCIIILQPKYKCDRGILEHELQHVRQWYRGGFFIFRWRYKRSRSFRLNSEVEAYLRQMRYPKCDGSFLTLERAAECLIWSRYNLGLTKEETLEILKQHLNKEKMRI